MPISSIASRRAGRLGAALVVMMMLAALLPAAASAATVPTITSAATTTFTVGAAGTFTVTTTGVPTPAIGGTGSLPSGVTFTDNSTGTGTLAGTPAAGTSGSYPLTFTVSNGNLPNAVQSFTLVVQAAAAPTITSAATTTFTIGVAGAFTVTTTGAPIPSIVRSGAALPSGLTFTDNGNGTGTLAGTPAAATNGSYALTFTASNGHLPNAVQTFTLVVSTVGLSVAIDQAPSQPDPTSTSPIDFTVVFSASVTGFATGDVTITGTAGGTKVGTVTAVNTTRYNVVVTGMTTGGTVIATVPANVALGESSQPNLASTSTDNQVTWAPATSSITLVTSAPIPPGAHNPVITWGQGFDLSVQFATNGASKTVQLQGTTDNVTWTTITSLTMNATGHASYHYTPIKNLWYRVVFAGTADLSAATSNTVRTVVRQIAILRPTNHGAVRSIARNASIMFSTTVRPARPELAPATVTFWFYRQIGGSWLLQTTRNVTIDSAGLASTTFTFATSGQWYVRSQANPTPVNANSVMSLVERYSVG